MASQITSSSLLASNPTTSNQKLSKSDIYNNNTATITNKSSFPISQFTTTAYEPPSVTTQTDLAPNNRWSCENRQARWATTMLISMVGLAILAIGIAMHFQVGAFSHTTQIESIVMMATGGGLFLASLVAMTLLYYRAEDSEQRIAPLKIYPKQPEEWSNA